MDGLLNQKQAEEIRAQLLKYRFLIDSLTLLVLSISFANALVPGFQFKEILLGFMMGVSLFGITLSIIFRFMMVKVAVRLGYEADFNKTGKDKTPKKNSFMKYLTPEIYAIPVLVILFIYYKFYGLSLFNFAVSYAITLLMTKCIYFIYIYMTKRFDLVDKPI